LLCHFGEFLLVEPAVLVGIEFHGAIGKCLWIWRADATWATASRATRTAAARTTESTAWASAGAAATSAGHLALDHFGQLVFRNDTVVVDICSCEKTLHPLRDLVLGQLAVLVCVE
jgi:hypothetical protein